MHAFVNSSRMAKRWLLRRNTAVTAKNHCSSSPLLPKKISCRQHFSYFPHFPADIRLGDSGVVPRHVGIRMPEDFCDDVDGHAVFDGQRGERMPRAMRREILRNIADSRQLLQVGIHLRIGGHRQQLTPGFAGLVGFVPLQYPNRLRQQRHTAHYRRLFPRLVNPYRTLFVGRDMLLAQMVRIRKGQSRQGTETEHVPDTVEPVVGHRFSEQRIQFLSGQRNLDVRFIHLHLIVPKRVLLDPFVADGIEDKVLQTAQQVDRPVVPTVVGRLHEGIQSVDIRIIDRIQRQVVFPVLSFRVFGHIAQQAMVFVRRELSDTYSDFSLPFVAVFRKFGKKHPRTAIRIFKALFDGEAVRLFTLTNQPVVGRKDICPITGDDIVDSKVYLVFVKRTFEPLVPALRLDLTAGVDFGREARSGDTGIDGCFALLGNFGLFAEENHGKCRSAHGCMGLNRLNVCSIEILRRKTMQDNALCVIRDLFSVRAKQVTISVRATCFFMLSNTSPKKRKNLTYH